MIRPLPWVRPPSLQARQESLPLLPFSASPFSASPLPLASLPPFVQRDGLAARRLDLRLGRRREAVRLNRQRHRDLPVAQDLHRQPARLHEADGAQRRHVNRRAALEPRQARHVHRLVLDAKAIVKAAPPRQRPHERYLAALEADAQVGPGARLLALEAPARVRAVAARVAPADTLPLADGARDGRKLVLSHFLFAPPARRRL